MIRRFFPAALLAAAVTTCAMAQSGRELRFCLRSDPKTFDPLQVEDDSSETVRYITGGVLLRVNRKTQELIPELAESWKVDRQGRRITFQLRRGVSFSDGTPFTADDVVYTINRLMDTKLHSPTADPFRSSSVPPQIAAPPTPNTISITFDAPRRPGWSELFDQVAILSRNSPRKLAAVLWSLLRGRLASRVSKCCWPVIRTIGNSRFHRQASSLPGPDSFADPAEPRYGTGAFPPRANSDLINSLDPELFEQLAHQTPGSVSDAGPLAGVADRCGSIKCLQPPYLPYKKAWFASQEFRRAISEAINREDLCKVVYKGHARPAAGLISPANRFWVNSSLTPHAFDVASAQRRLKQAGLRLSRCAGTLYDQEGRAVEFSLMTNAGNKTRERIAAMIQQDLQAIGIRLNVVTLDFPSLIERMTQTFQYEVCLLGLTNLDLDPSAEMNVLAQFRRRPSLEPQSEDTGHSLGSRDRSPDEGPGRRNARGAA